MLFSAYDSYGLESKMVAGRCGRSDVIRVRPAEGQQRGLALFGRASQVVLEFPSFVPGQLGLDQILPLQQQANISLPQAMVVYFDHRNRGGSELLPRLCLCYSKKPVDVLVFGSG